MKYGRGDILSLLKSEQESARRVRNAITLLAALADKHTDEEPWDERQIRSAIWGIFHLDEEANGLDEFLSDVIPVIEAEFGSKEAA